MDITDGNEEERPAQRIQRLVRERKRRQRLRESEAKRQKAGDVNGAEGCFTYSGKRSALLSSKCTAMKEARSAEAPLRRSYRLLDCTTCSLILNLYCI